MKSTTRLRSYYRSPK